jgi:hypothetical protein
LGLLLIFLLEFTQVIDVNEIENIHLLKGFYALVAVNQPTEPVAFKTIKVLACISFENNHPDIKDSSGETDPVELMEEKLLKLVGSKFVLFGRPVDQVLLQALRQLHP